MRRRTLSVLMLALGGCGLLPAADAPDAAKFESELRPMIELYSADRHDLERRYPIRWSTTRRARLERFFTAEEAELAKVDFSSLSQNGAVDYTLFRNHLRHEQSELELDARQASEMEPLAPFAPTIANLEESRRRMEPIDPAKAAALLSDMRKTVDAAMKVEPANIKAKMTVVNRAAIQIGMLRESLKAWFNFYHGYNANFTWWVDEPYKKTDQSLESYEKFLREKVLPHGGGESDIIGDPVGRQALVDDLAYNLIPYTPEELIALAKKEYAWCEQQMIRNSRELGYGDDWRKALEYVKSKYVEPGKQTELVHQFAEEAIDYVTKHDLVTVPELAREDWWEEMLSPERQLVAPFLLGGRLVLVASPFDTQTEEQKQMTLRGNNIHFTRAVVLHELIPGHHLQGFMAARYRTYRAPFDTPFWTEGNAFYWEMLLWDMGYPRGPEDRIGALFWRMHRCARIIFSLSFHMEQMSAKECIDFLVDKVGFERANAAAEVRRSFDGSYEPIYQCAYMLGALQFYALHKEMVDSGKMTNRAFHDALLQENRIPVEMIRADLRHEKLPRDFKTNWRFWEEGAQAK